MPAYPSLYQLNTRVYLTALSRQLGRSATLDDWPDAELDAYAKTGFDWIWLLSVWQTGSVGQQVSRSHPGWREQFLSDLPDLQEADIGGSGFAITDYTVAKEWGGNAALSRLRSRLQQRGLRLMLDFVPNHTAPDHLWTQTHPDFYIAGTEADLARAPQNYYRLTSPTGSQIFAHGRDPYFPGWPDTLQLNYGNPELQAAMRATLSTIAGQCDGVRCDMAMLMLPEVFERTWGIPCAPFWEAAIAQVRQTHPDFVFMAEVYWDLEWTLQQQGFDYTYDKRLYDRLEARNVNSVRDHLRAEMDFQRKLARFLENHDERRAAAAFPPGVHQAAAIITFLAPGLRFFHQGQFNGCKLRTSVHLLRAATEAIDPDIQAFYQRLLHCLEHPIVREGTWQLLDAIPAWGDNATWKQFILYLWQFKAEAWLVVINYAPAQGQCYVPLPIANLAEQDYEFKDLMGPYRYERSGSRLCQQGLYLDLPAWGYHVFAITPLDKSAGGG
ncbi:alpha-amylase family glycosyl hydrolase [Trichothermofontia sp.]